MILTQWWEQSQVHYIYKEREKTIIDEKYVEQTPKYVEQTPKKKGHKKLWITAGVLWAIVILLFIVVFAALSSPTSAPATKPQQTTTAPKSIDDQIQSLVTNTNLLGKAHTTYVADAKTVQVTDDIGDGNLTNGMIVGEIKDETFKIQQALWQSNLHSHYDIVQVFVTMNVVDSYGKTSNQIVASSKLTANNAQQFQWDNMTNDMAWQDYDGSFIAPWLLK